MFTVLGWSVTIVTVRDDGSTWQRHYGDPGSPDHFYIRYDLTAKHYDSYIPRSPPAGLPGHGPELPRP